MSVTKLEGLTRVLKLRPEIRSLIERGEFKSIQEFDPSPSLADVVTYYEYLDLCRSNVGLPPEIKSECSYIDDIRNRLNIFIDPKEFFKRTYLSENMDDIIVKVFAGLLEGEAIRRDGSVTTLRSRIIILPSLMGGGKTHLLITLLQIIRLYNELVVEKNDPEAFREALELLDASLAERLYKLARETGPRRIRLAAIDGTSEKVAPDPHKAKPVKKAIIIRSGGIEEVKVYNVRTLWGAIAHYLGNYSIMAQRDESNTVPSKEELKELLSGDPFLIMIDEPLVYASRYGEDEKLRDFFQVLAIAIKESANGILILSIPVSQEELTSGEAKGIAREIYEVLSRTQPGLEIVPPLKAPEIANVLKKRLFENDEEELKKIGREVAKLIVSKGGEIVKNAIISIFRSVPEFEDAVENSYPFSPLYLELLEDYFNHLKYLQRTRDAIRITIMALATIYNGLYRWFSGDFYLIEPYHIPIHDSSIKSYLVNPNYSDYQVLMTMYDKDVEEASRKTSRPQLSRIISSFIWLRTIIGRGIPGEHYLKLYPTINDIVLAVYDPAAFSQQNIGPGAIGDALNELCSYSNYMIVHKNRYFMTPLIPIDELIRKKIRDVSDISAQKKICDIVKEMFPLEIRRRKQPEVVSKVFKEVHVVGLENRDIIPTSIQRDDYPVLVVFSYEPRDDEISTFITRNNIVVIIPSMSMQVEDPGRGKVIARDLLISLAKELTAIESIDINELKRLYGEEIAPDKYKQLKDRGNEIRRKITQLLQNQIFNRIIIGKPKWEIKQPIGSVISGVDESAVKAVEEILIENSYIPPNYTFSKDEIILLAKALGKTCIDKTSGRETICKEIEIGELWSWFITTLEPPLRYVVVDFNSFLEGVRQLYEEDLVIAFIYGTDFIWKDVKNLKPSQPVDRGDWENVKGFVRRLSIDIKSLKIVPWTVVVQKFINQLKALGGVKVEGNVKKLIRIKVSYTDVFGERIDEDLDTFLQKDSWLETSRTAIFWEIIEYPEYIFSLNIVAAEVGDKLVDATKGIEAEPEQNVNIKLNINAIDYPFPIIIKASMNGELIHQETIEGGKRKDVYIKITPHVPGEHQLLIEAKGNDPKSFTQRRTLILRVPGEIGEQLELDSNRLKALLKDASYSKIVLNSIEIGNMERIIELIRTLGAERNIRVHNAKVNNLELHGLRSKGTSLTIESGIFESFDELRAFIESLSRIFKFESGAIRIAFEGMDVRNEISKLIDIIEKVGVKDIKYHVYASKRVG